MAWKKSKDGGIDYEVEELIRHQNQEPESFNPFATAMTMTSAYNHEEVGFERPLTAQEKIERFRRNQRQRAELKNTGAYKKRRR